MGETHCRCCSWTLTSQVSHRLLPVYVRVRCCASGGPMEPDTGTLSVPRTTDSDPSPVHAFEVKPKAMARAGPTRSHEKLLLAVSYSTDVRH